MERVERDNEDFLFIDGRVRSTGYQVLSWSVDGSRSVFRCIKDGEDPGEAFEITTSLPTVQEKADDLVAAIIRRTSPTG
jgi:hypothetical protein